MSVTVPAPKDNCLPAPQGTATGLSQWDLVN